MIFRLPTLEDEDALAEYVEEHEKAGEYGISACHGLRNMEYADWVSMIHEKSQKGTDEWGSFLVLLCVADEKIIGLLSVRYDLSRELSDKYGDIGYGVRPSERGKGYATMMLKHALDICREKGMEKVRLGCYKDNIPSARTIVKNGGILEEEADKYSEGRISQYFSIKL